MVVRQPSKLDTRVRFPSLAHFLKNENPKRGIFLFFHPGV